MIKSKRVWIVESPIGDVPVTVALSQRHEKSVKLPARDERQEGSLITFVQILFELLRDLAIYERADKFSSKVRIRRAPGGKAGSDDSSPKNE